MNTENGQHQHENATRVEAQVGPSQSSAQDSLSLPTQHASSSISFSSSSSSSSPSITDPLPQQQQQPSISDSNPSLQLPNGIHHQHTTNSQPPAPPLASSPPSASHPSSSSPSVDALLTASQQSASQDLPPNRTPSSNTNGNGVSLPSSTLDAPPASALPNDQAAVLSPLKVDGQSVENSGKPESISADPKQKVVQVSSDGPEVGNAVGANGNGTVNGNENGVASGSAPLGTADSGFVDGPSMVVGAPGSVDAAAQSLSQERLTEGQNPLPSSVSPSLAPPQQQAQQPAPSASPTPAPIPPPIAASSESLAPSPLPPQQQQHQPSPSLPIPSPAPESTSSNHLSPAPPAAQPPSQPQPQAATPSEDVKMTDGTAPQAPIPAPAAVASTPTPAVQAPVPESIAQPQTQSQPQEAQVQPPQLQNASIPQPQQQQGDTPVQPPPSESSSLPQQQYQQPYPQPNVQDSASISAPPAQPFGAPIQPLNVPQQPQTQQAQAPAPQAASSALPDPAASASGPSAVDSEPPNKRQRFEGAVDAYGTPIIEMTAAQIKFAQNSIKSLKSRPEAPAFLQPVDPIALGIPQYRNFITDPADLGSIDIKLALTSAASKSQAAGGAEIKPTEKVKQAAQFGLDPKRDVFPTATLWEEEVRRVFSNCRKFNGPEHPLSKGCDAMEKTFDKQMSSFPSARPQEYSSTAGDDSPNDKKIRRPSNPVPTIRRSSDDAGGRPKREIHPPPPKDMPYWDEPASGISNRGGAGGTKRKAKTSAANSVAERAYYEKVNKDELRFCEKVVQELYGPKHQAVAWVFYDLVDRNLDFAPAYYASIKNPISLREIQSKLRSGDYENRRSFDADMQLLFRNCFTFNPPGTDVHTMGQKVKQAYESRMRSIPKAPPFVAPQEFGDEYGYYDDGEDLDDSSDALMAAQIRQQIESLQANLAQLEGSQNKNPKAIANTKASLASMQSSAMTKPQRTRPPPSASTLPSAAPPAPRKSSGGGGKKANGEKKKAGGGTKRKNPSSGGAGGKRKSNGDAGSDEDVRVVTYEQKEELASKITELPDDRLDGALKIIAEDKPHSTTDEEEIELDIDDLTPKTLYKLYKYVVRPKKPRTGGAGGAQKKKKTSTNKGGHKNRVLDEAAEAKRIASLQTQLATFEQGGVAQPAAGPSGAHDDMVDSGSSGSESDSDSDDDAY